MRLNRAMEQYEKLNANARQAVLMADEARKQGDAAKATEYTNAAESFANRLIAIEGEVEDLKQLQLQATQAADQAKAAVSQNSMTLQKKLAERQQLLSQLDQAKMQEQMNTAMSSLQETVGEDVPTFTEVRDKIERRYARAQGASELEGATVESKMIEVEQQALNIEAKTRLEEIRSQLGLDTEAEEVTTATEPATESAPEGGGETATS